MNSTTCIARAAGKVTWWWNREAISSREVRVGATPIAVTSDPEFCGDGIHADEVRGFVDVEFIDAGNVQVEVFRWGGATPSALKALDAVAYTTITVAKVVAVEWPSPPPPWLQTVLKVSRTAGAGTYTTVVRLLQTSRRDD